MNKTYKTVFNYHTQTWTAVSEIASARGKSKKNHLKLSVAIASSLLGLVSMNAYADTTLTCTTSATDTTGNVICGNSAAANAASAISIGSSANAVTRNSIAIGNSSNTAVTTAVTYTSVVANEPTASADSVAGVSNIAIGNHSQTAVFTATAGVRNAGSVAIGNYAYAAPTSVAIGPEAVAAGNTWDGIDENGSATAVGYKAYAVGKTGQAQGGTAIGARTLASGASSVALGGASDSNGAKALGMFSTALGWNTNTVGDSAVAVGASARTGAANAIAIGKGAQATAAQSISIGTGNIVSGANAGAIGDPSYVSGAGTYTIGNNNGTAAVPVTATNSGVFGNNNALPTASTDGIRVVGNSNTVNSSNVMVMGNSVIVGAGLDGAVVLGNASTVSAAVDTASATVNGLTYSGFAGSAPADGDVMSVGSVSAPRQIQNVAAGRIAADSLDAINGSELYMTNNILGNVASSTAAILGGNAAVGTDGTLTMSDVGGTGEATVHDAIKAVNAIANKGWNLQTNGDTADKVAPGDTVQLLDGKNIKVTRSGKDVTIATADDVSFTTVTADKTTVGSVVTDGTTNKISGLSAGTADTDAVNVSQLKPIVDGLGGGATVNADGTVTAPSYTITKTDGTSYPAANNVGDALSNLNSEVIKPITFTGDSGSSAQTLGSSFAIVAGNNSDTSTTNLKTTVTDGKVEISMANAPTFTGTVTAPKFMTSGANAITVDGTAGTIGGLTNTTFDPNNIVSGQAATEDQLKSVNDVANKGWNLQTNGDTADKVAPGDTVQLLDGKNIKVTRSGKDVTIATADDVSFTTVTADKTTVGSVVTDGTTNKISGLSDGTVAAGSSEAITGNQLYNTAATVASSLGGTSVVNADGTVTAGLSVGSNNYTNVQDALSALNTVASAHNTTTAGTNIEVVETTNANGSKNYEVKTKDDVTFNKVTVGGITIDGTSNKISGLADGAVSVDSSDAINGSQLYGVSGSIKNILGGNSTVNSDGSLSMTNVGGTGKDNINDAIQSINTTANKGWNLTANGASSSNVAPGATVDLNNTDGNITITKADNNVTFNLNKDLKADSVTTGNTTMNTNGVSISGGSNGTVSLTGSGLDNGGNKITHVADGAVTADSTDAVNGSQLYEVKNSISDVVNNATFGITAQDGNSVKNNLNKTVSVVGGADSAAAASASNIKTVVKDGKVEIQMVDAPTFTGEVTANGGVTVGDHLTVSSGATVDMGGNKVTNVAAGTADTDAVNVAQMNKAIGGITQNVSNLYGKIDGAVKDANAGIAGAMASAGVPQAYMPGKSMVAASGSTYRGATALAIGVSTITDSGKWVFKGTVNSNSRGYVGATIGAGYQW